MQIFHFSVYPAEVLPETLYNRILQEFQWCDRRYCIGDTELQKWAENSAGEWKHFPSNINSRSHLLDTLANIIFRVSVQHCFYNSEITWYVTSFPYSLRGLFHPMPTRKGSFLSLKKFVAPKYLLPATLGPFTFFHRKIAPTQTLSKSYANIDLGKKADREVQNFFRRVNEIDWFIANREMNSRQTFNFMRPSRLPYYCWI